MTKRANQFASTSSAAITPPPRPHVDDIAVDALAARQKARLAEKRDQGFNGWDDPRRCSVEKLAMLMAQSMCKGKVVDVANFAAMLHSRAAAPQLVGEHAMRTLLRGAREHRASVASQLRTILADDSYAFTFQTMAQYRTALLKAFDAVATTDERTPQACAHCGGSGRQEDVFEQAARQPSTPAVGTSYGTPEAVAERIRQWLGRYGRENTSSLLLYEAMNALHANAAPQPSVQRAEPDDDEDEGATTPAGRVEWDKFPAWLIDHHDGDTITEELLQHALVDMLKAHPPVAQQAAPTHLQRWSKVIKELPMADQPAEEAGGVAPHTHARIIADKLMAASKALGGEWNGALDDALTHADTLVDLLAAPAAANDGLKTLLAELPGMEENPRKGDMAFRCGANGALRAVAARIREMLDAPAAGAGQHESEQKEGDRVLSGDEITRIMDTMQHAPYSRNFKDHVRRKDAWAFGRAVESAVVARIASSAPQAATGAQGLTRAQIEMLRALLVSIRPEFGAPGSRDVDVARQQKRIDCALGILAQAAPSAAALPMACPHQGRSDCAMFGGAVAALKEGA